MAEAAHREVFVHLLPSLIPPGSLKGGVAVVVDVLRATTVMVQALASGCESIRPCSEIDEARDLAATLPAGTAILAGERAGLPIEGFDMANSPGDYQPDVCRGKTLVMTTTNGTRAILASLDAAHVLIASFSNLAVTVRALREAPGAVHVVCSGTNGFISFEDAILAGAIASDLSVPRNPGGPSWPFGNDEAHIVSRLWGAVPLDEDPTDPTELAGTLAQGRGGTRVRAIGLAADITEAARIDRFPWVAELQRDPLRIVRVG